MLSSTLTLTRQQQAGNGHRDAQATGGCDHPANHGSDRLVVARGTWNVRGRLQEEAWLGKGIVLYEKIEKEVDKKVEVDSWQLKIEESVVDNVMVK